MRYCVFSYTRVFLHDCPTHRDVYDTWEYDGNERFSNVNILSKARRRRLRRRTSNSPPPIFLNSNKLFAHKPV